ncbi:MAG: DUF3391 domain-containing protein [Pseudomonadota bacterium]
MQNKVKIPVSKLEPGMYISLLDRAWIETPFPFQGFVASQKDIHTLTELCRHVYIDIEKSDEKLKSGFSTGGDQHPTKVDAHNSTKHSEQQGRPAHYGESTSVQDEFTAAKQAYRDLTKTCEELFKAATVKRKLSFLLLKQAVTPMVESVIRNPHALLMLTRLNKKASCFYQHALSCAVLAVATGRQIGLPQNMLLDLALGASLLDVGKVRLPSYLLTKHSRLNDDEMRQVRKHVQYSVEAAADSEHITPNVLKMIETHHERHNGSGYPYGLCGDQIPLLGKIAGIVDSFDAITSNRPYAPQATPDEAMHLLYSRRDVDFQSELLEQLVQSIGLYPAGNLVELSDGRVGIVLAQHKTSALKPLVMVVLENDKRFAKDYYECDITKHQLGKDGHPLTIGRNLQPGTYGINPVEHISNFIGESARL